MHLYLCISMYIIMFPMKTSVLGAPPFSGIPNSKTVSNKCLSDGRTTRTALDELAAQVWRVLVSAWMLYRYIMLHWVFPKIRVTTERSISCRFECFENHYTTTAWKWSGDCLLIGSKANLGHGPHWPNRPHQLSKDWQFPLSLQRPWAGFLHVSSHHQNMKTCHRYP